MKKQDFISQIKTWETEGLITIEQSAKMQVDVAQTVSERSSNFFISSLMYMGAFALSLGALLFIATNWSGFSKSFKLGLSLLLPIIPLVYAYIYLVVREQERVLARAANVCGVILVGGTLSLIGQIYNLEANYVSFLWTWTLLTLPFVFIFRKPENVVFSATLFGVASLYWMVTVLEESDIADSTSVILVTGGVLLYSAVLYVVGSLYRNALSWEDSCRFLRLGSATTVLITLFITTFEFYARAVVGDTYWNSGSTEWMPVSLMLNAVFLIALVVILMRAVRKEEYHTAFQVFRLFGFYLIVKYITLFYSMMDTGLFFMIGGTIFILGGWALEKNKQSLLDFFQRTSESRF